MPPKTRRTASQEDTTTTAAPTGTDNAGTEPKKQRLDNEYENLKEKQHMPNTNGEKPEETEYSKEHPTRLHEKEAGLTHKGTEKEKHPMKHKGTHKTTHATAAKSHEHEHGESKVLEKGKMVFYYRPKLDHEHVNNPNDIQRFTFAMTPEGNKIHRLFVVGSKTFPEAGSRARCFAFVEKVSDNIDEINKFLQPYDYDTKTRGERHQEGSRVAGEALYELVEHGPGHVHLAYVLDIPDEPTETQKAFHIHKEASYICTIKNPEAGPSASGVQGLQPKQKAQFPAELMEHFKGKVKSQVRFTSLQPEFLNYEGCEMLMFASGKDPKSEFKEIMEQLENEAEELEEMVDKKTHHHPSESIYEERKLDEKVIPDATAELK